MHHETSFLKTLQTMYKRQARAALASIGILPPIKKGKKT